MRRLLGSPTVIRIVGLAASSGSYFIVLGLAYRDLGVAHYGVLAVAVNLVALIQTVNLGVGPALTNRVALVHGGRLQPRELRAWLTAMGLASLAVALSVTLVGTLILDLIPLGIMARAAILAVVGNVMASFSSCLVGAGRLHAYFILQIAQSISLVLGGIIASIASPTLLAYAYAFVGSAIVPGVLAMVLLSRGTLGEEAPSCSTSVIQAVHASLSLGVRQVSAVVGFGLTPTVAALVGGPELAAEYAVPFRIYMAAWSIVGVVYLANWPSMSRGVSAGDNLEVRSVARAVRRRSLWVASALVVPVAGLAPLMNRLVGIPFSREGVAIAVVIAGAVVVRAAGTGNALRMQASKPALRSVLVELVLAAMGTLLAMQLAVALGVAAVPAVALALVALVSMVYTRRWAVEQDKRVRLSA